MPLYIVATRTTLNHRTKTLLTDVITATHCSMTGAPEMLTSVIFATSRKMRDTHSICVMGSIRAGRTSALIAALSSTLRTAVSQAMLCAPAAVDLRLVELPAAWIMEYGEIVPEPGEEAAWLARLFGARAAENLGHSLQGGNMQRFGLAEPEGSPGKQVVHGQ